MAVSVAVCEIFSVKEWYDLENNQSINQSINQYVFSAPSTQVRADEALQMSSQYTYS